MPSGPSIAVVGSADPAREDYQPKVVQHEKAKQASVELGAALARHGCCLVVYSSSPAYLEADVVKGFVGASRPTDSRTIQVRFPLGAAAATFPEADARAELFDYQADPNTDWEASFYRSLPKVDGAVIIGGGPSVLIAGYILSSHRTPVIAIPGFGGASQTIWQSLVPGRDLASDDDKQAMARPIWNSDASDSCVASLVAQIERRKQEIDAERSGAQELRAQLQRRSIIVALLFSATLAALVTGLSVDKNTLLFPLLVYFSGPLAGASGAVVRVVWNAERPDSFLRNAALGLVAGGISGVLFLIAQVSEGIVVPSQPTALAFVVMIGFISGFTFDRVFKKLAETDVTDTSILNKKG